MGYSFPWHRDFKKKKKKSKQLAIPEALIRIPTLTAYLETFLNFLWWSSKMVVQYMANVFGKSLVIYWTTEWDEPNGTSSCIECKEVVPQFKPQEGVLGKKFSMQLSHKTHVILTCGSQKMMTTIILYSLVIHWQQKKVGHYWIYPLLKGVYVSRCRKRSNIGRV